MTLIEVQNDTAGRVATVAGSNGFGTLGYTYDDTSGRLTNQKLNGNIIAGPTYNTTTGAMTGVTYPSGAANAGNATSGTFGFDTRGRPNAVSWSGRGTTLITSSGATPAPSGRTIDQSIDGSAPTPSANAFAYDAPLAG